MVDVLIPVLVRDLSARLVEQLFLFLLVCVLKRDTPYYGAAEEGNQVTMVTARTRKRSN